jgi:formylmethanofuran dehydrogenase subunit E
LKVVDYGKMAATFVDLATGQAVRVAATTEHKAPHDADHLEFWRDIPDENIFTVWPVEVSIKPEDLPGRPLRTVTCARCGEWVRDGREVTLDGQVYCKACANQPYYRVKTAAEARSVE